MSEQVLTDRTALVTGASRGIGRSIALSLAAQGAHVTLVARNAELLEEVHSEIVAEGGSAQVIVADLLAPESTDQIAQALESD
jgi:short-subunit dehydrogenase